jgi:hypothetical protein
MRIGFNITNKEREDVNEMSKFAKNANPDFHLEKIAVDKDDNEDTAKAVAQVSLPWLILLVVSIFGWITYSICCVCDW